MKNNKKGFTLVELVIVVAVMAILVAVAIPTVQSIVGTATTNVQATNAQTIESMLKLAIANSKSLEDEEDIAKVIADAKLNITKDTFYFDAATGEVSVEDNGGIAISFTADTITVGSTSINQDGSAVSGGESGGEGGGEAGGN